MGRRAALVAGGLLLLGAVGAVGALTLRGPDDDEAPSAVPEPPAVRSKPAALERVRGLAVRVPPRRIVALRARPGGRILARVGARTEFGSPQTLAVAFRKGGWIAVRSPALENEQLGWVRAAPLRPLPRPVELEVDLSRRELSLRGEDGVERRISVAIGAADTPTPAGEFYVTDKLRGADFGPYYGCCILALSGRQPNLPQGWSGGDRLAIHGSPTSTWGQAVSNGCFHADEPDLRYLMKNVPLGTEVRVHA